MILNMKNKFVNMAFAGVLALNFYRIPTTTATTAPERANLEVVGATSTPKPTGIKFGNLKLDLKDKIQAVKAERAHLKNVKITAIGSNSVTVDNAGTSVTVNISDKTQLRRRFWGKSELTEFSVGDKVDVIGKWTDDTKTAINAVLIRNESIQKRFGVFFGTVKSLTGTEFAMTTIQRDDETVTIGTAKLINRKGGAITQADIKVGDRVRVRGLWDSNLKTITETKEVKDFSLPVKPSASPSPTATP